jgi:hypothetical protein
MPPRGGRQVTIAGQRADRSAAPRSAHLVWRSYPKETPRPMLPVDDGVSMLDGRDGFGLADVRARIQGRLR